MSVVAELLAKERAEDERLIQSVLGNAIHHSLEAVTRKPLPEKMVLLLQKLAAIQAFAPGAQEAPTLSSPARKKGRPETSLDRATRHIARAKQIIAYQRNRVAQLQAERRPVKDAMSMLDAFVETLATMEYHRRLLCEEVEGKDRVSRWIFARLGSTGASRLTS
ncbi:hypothetical protein ACNHKD_08135 [Methylocystis sp. JAN1]|uniref:hypothetical protein n=1 Tax=Methylocystis sp. JAN1 TaxID=3397211 RepID=UPI003FA2B493